VNICTHQEQAPCVRQKTSRRVIRNALARQRQLADRDGDQSFHCPARNAAAAAAAAAWCDVACHDRTVITRTASTAVDDTLTTAVARIRQSKNETEYSIHPFIQGIVCRFV